ncbi:2Fe-2S iron-sulfur cluster-binding protein [Prescottella sp. R16]|uniref:2Fe-2S iron-sulfur cluster-binding protein n=1 Tax=Prescottella sp. R16 TaxID=3064529 RepID=UPI00272E7688|nr:2Fe-2S iron-sulfur cluster-binding protein [Prescottella sp. R16]
MPKVTYIAHDGRETVLAVEPGVSIMRAALNNGVSGIYAECGGETMCATCHVYVDDADLDKFPPPNEDEDEMLEATACDREHNSRLSCGLLVGDDDLVVRMPEAQR